MDFDDAESLIEEAPHFPSPSPLETSHNDVTPQQSARLLQLQPNENPPLQGDISSLPLEYQQCPHCSRNFFKGKLKFHLKLCNAANPMLVSPRKTPGKSHNKLTAELPGSSQEQRCPKCGTKLPSFLYERHMQRCQKEQEKKQENKKATTDVNFKQKPQIFLPAIKRSAREPERLKKAIMKEVYKVKVREELSCFRRAQEIKQVECVSCGRIFSKEASLRHIPICQTLRTKAQKSIALHKKKTVGNSLFQHSFNRSAQGHKKSRSLMQESPHNQIGTAPIQAIQAAE